MVLLHRPASRPIRPEHRLDGRPIDVQINQDRNLHGVVVVSVARRELEIPVELTRVGVERDDRAGIQVVTRPLIVRVVGPRVANPPERQIRLRIV